MRLKGRTALVTGAGRNIGKAIAIRLAKEGGQVVLCARTENEIRQVAAEIQEFGGHALAVRADVSDPTSVQAMVTKAVERFGGIDILVNNVGIRPYRAVTDMTCDEWDEVIRVNLSSAFYCARAVIPHMIAQKWGRIINISGKAGFTAVRNRAHVAASKAGLHGLTRALALELAPHSITVNTVAPGFINTTRPLQWYPELQDPVYIKRTIPLGRLGEPNDIASVCAFLASDDASFITGQVIHVNGGQLMN